MPAEQSPLQVYYCPTCLCLFGHNYPKYTDDDTPPPTCPTCHPRATTTPITIPSFASRSPAAEVQVPAAADHGEDPGARRERLFLAAINSITGETNAEVEAAKDRWSPEPPLTDQLIAVRLREAGVVDKFGVLTPMSQWTSKQLRDIVLWWRAARMKSIQCSGGSAHWLLRDLQDAFRRESRINLDLALHFSSL